MKTYIKGNTKFYVLNPLQETHDQLIKAPAHYTYRIFAKRPRLDGKESRNSVSNVVIICRSSNDYMAKQAIHCFWHQFSNEAPEYLIVCKRRYTSYGYRVGKPDMFSFDASLFSCIDF